MKEIYEFRINQEFAHLLFTANEGVNLGKSVRIVQLTKEDERFQEIGNLQVKIANQFNRFFFSSWIIRREYSQEELEKAALFQVKITKTFEPSGEECGTVYDETKACAICGANAPQVGLLRLKDTSIPITDIAKTIGSEIVVSKKMASLFDQNKLRGAKFNPVNAGKKSSDYFQLIEDSPPLMISSKTIAGNDPFKTIDFTPEREAIIQGRTIKISKQIFKCPKGHTLGANLLSEAFIIESPIIYQYDFFASTQKIGTRLGLLRQYPVYLCSPIFKKMIEEEKLSGFDFEVANICTL